MALCSGQVGGLQQFICRVGIGAADDNRDIYIGSGDQQYVDPLLIQAMEHIRGNTNLEGISSPYREIFTFPAETSGITGLPSG